MVGFTDFEFCGIDEIQSQLIEWFASVITSYSIHYTKLYEIPGAIDATDAVLFGESVGIGESNAVMAIHALEMGDYNLVVVHLQRSLTSLNESMLV